MINFKAIKSRRAGLGLKQAFVAERVGISQAHYSSIECGRDNPSIPTLEAIARVLGVSVVNFLSDNLDLPPPGRWRLVRGADRARRRRRMWRSCSTI